MSKLSHAELADICNTSQGAAQLRYFRNLGLHVFRDGSGHPVVTWEVLNAITMGRHEAHDDPALDLAGAFGKKAAAR